MAYDATAREAAEALRDRVETVPQVALVLGSGLGDLAESVDDAVVVPTNEVAGYPPSTVPGHHGRLLFGRLEGVAVVILQGRAHLYEGYSPTRITFPTRLVYALGARRLLLTNAAGGINPSFSPGTLMFIADHINFAGAHLQHGRDGRPARARRRRSAYTPGWLHQAERAALREGVATRCGTYLWTRGPSYETKAEITAFRRLGADAVGMSTVPEALQAAVLGMDVLGISTITNPAAGLSEGALSHEDVLAVGRRVRADVERLIRAVLRALESR